MSWSEIKKAINSDLTEPLNYLAWINDLAIFGEDGYVFNDFDKLITLATQSQSLYDNKIAVANFFNYMIYYNHNIGNFCKKLIGDLPVFEEINTIHDLLGSEDAFDEFIKSENAVKLLVSASASMREITYDIDLVKKLLDNNPSKNILLNSRNGMNFICNNSIINALMEDSSYFTMFTTNKNAISSLATYSVSINAVYNNIGDKANTVSNFNDFEVTGNVSSTGLTVTRSSATHDGANLKKKFNNPIIGMVKFTESVTGSEGYSEHSPVMIGNYLSDGTYYNRAVVYGFLIKFRTSVPRYGVIVRDIAGGHLQAPLENSDIGDPVFVIWGDRRIGVKVNDSVFSIDLDPRVQARDFAIGAAAYLSGTLTIAFDKIIIAEVS